MQRRRRLNSWERIVASLVGLSVVSVGFFMAGALANHSLRFAYLLWNLFLAWLPFLVSLVLIYTLRRRLWSSWLPLGLTFVWVLLLPNSFYMISDFIHIQDVLRHNLLYDVVMFTACIFTAALLGFCSLYLVHSELRKRMRLDTSSLLIALIIFLCSFAIYLGRDLRWNSWDVFLNPAGILFDVSDNLFHPLQNLEMFSMTFSFFVLLGSLYIVGWQLGEATRQAPPAHYADEGRGGGRGFIPMLSSLEKLVSLAPDKPSQK